MKHSSFTTISTLFFLLFALSITTHAQDAAESASAQDPFSRLSVIPRGLGVNIYSGGDDGINHGDTEFEINSVGATTDFRWIRVDFHWKGTPRTFVNQDHRYPVYTFKYYDDLLRTLTLQNLRPIFILDDVDPDYDQDKNATPNCFKENGKLNCDDQVQFARFVGQAVSHFKGKGIVWEMYNEPNLPDFWKPQPGATVNQTTLDYTRLAIRVGKKIRAIAPNEIYVGPATSNIEKSGLDFLELCFKQGLLDYWTAISVHPYRKNDNPETVLDSKRLGDYMQLRALIAKYAHNKHVPIISSEWGYSSYWPQTSMDDFKQAKYLVRSWLVNLASDIKISIWYKWHSSCEDSLIFHHYRRLDGPPCPDEDHKIESGYGIRHPDYGPKSASDAASQLITQLKGYHADLLSKELAENPAHGRQTNFAIRFLKGNDYKVAAWTTSSTPRQVLIFLEPGKYVATGFFGENLGTRTAGRNGLKITLTDAPLYLTTLK
ncbi:MAG: cellulase family glycosylhydrolase [Pyrinomonadaceae bacterium]